jgi:hypothetical protein
VTTRSDLHSPKHLITENYEYVFGLDTRPSEDSGWQDSPPKEHEVGIDNLLSSWDGRCAHCGQRNVRWLAVLRHTSGEYLGVGFTCLDNRFSRATADFQRLKRQGELDRQLQKVKKARLAWVAKNPDLAFLGDKEPALPEASKRNGFLLDLSRKLRQYGDLSEKQAEAARKSLARDVEWAAERAAKEAAKRAAADARGPAQPVPAGRQTVSGEVVGFKEVEDRFAPYSRWGGVPTILKMVVLDDRGFKVYGTVPNSLGSFDKGARLSFDAQLEQSRDDQFFGFFKRPTKARLLDAQPAAEAPAAPRSYDEIFGK